MRGTAMRPRGALLVAALGFGFFGMTRVAVGANVDSNDAVSIMTQANGGGCYPVSIAPGLLDMLALVDPEWAPVDVGAHLPPLSDPVTLHGTVASSKVNEAGDFPGDHVTDDQNTLITVDPADMGRVATGNIGPQGLDAGNLEVEWEIGKYPLFAWSGLGDGFVGIGRWIWDCGHPLPNPTGTCSVTMSEACVIDADCAAPQCPSCQTGETCTGVVFNYHSELHPPQTVVVTRRHGYANAVSRTPRGGPPATRVDVWISPDGGGAADVCLLTHLPNALSLLAQSCFPLSQPLANVNTSNVVFDIPLPPRPAGNTEPPKVTVIERTPRLPKPAVTTTFVDGMNPVVHTVIDMTTPINGKLPSQVGKTIVASWVGDTTPTTRVRIVVTGIEIVNPLKAVTPAVPLKQPSVGGPTPGWIVYLEVNGDWRKLRGLHGVSAPGTMPQHITFDAAMPAGDTLHLHATGKSLACLESQLYGQSLFRDVQLYGLTDGAKCLADTSKDIGAFDITFGAPDFGSGTGTATYSTQSVGGDGGTCSATTSQLCVTNADCPMGEMCNVTGGAFKLHYRIIKVD